MKLLRIYKEPAPTKSQAPRNKPDRGLTPERKNQASQPTREPRSNTRDTRKEANREPRPPRERKPAPVADIDSTRLYLGNLSYEAAESDLEELFKGVGPVRSVEVVYNRHTHKSKGYGFVEMLRLEDAKRAVEILHDQPFMGRNLVVSNAKAKEEGSREKASDDQPSAQAQPVAAESAPVAVAETESSISAEPEANVVEEVHTFSSEDAKKETFV